ncbi:Cyclic nucleotide-binding protein [Pseudocohnilembus persalinus]|uniref:Cyclic nucleotide-binding protein n=1 Tax=Pseudocohnilembus persalinus TaxID=266149 RepID=A0A0V0QXQ5_PSEPJ|nr:Cyclic nucleotide-binding protein [Pseudocohnilembus persalinus]|eukprot:KRX07119.1 Cyclic nucleotide-binding protein [Pseudocohnilembus persalinus]
MKEVLCGPGEVLYAQNETDQRLFFVQKGQVELYTWKDNSELENSQQKSIYKNQNQNQNQNQNYPNFQNMINPQYINSPLNPLIQDMEDEQFKHIFKNQPTVITHSQINTGNFFGQDGFFAELPRATYARSVSVSHIMYCYKNDFIDVLKNFPLDYHSQDKQQELLMKNMTQ